MGGKKKKRKGGVKQLRLANSDSTATVDAEDYAWAKEYTWLLGPDGHVYRDGLTEDGNYLKVYLCNEVVLRSRGIPLSGLGPPAPLG